MNYDLYAIAVDGEGMVHAVRPRIIRIGSVQPHHRSWCGRIVRFGDKEYTKVSRASWVDGRKCKTCVRAVGDP